MDCQQDNMSSGVGGAMSASWHEDEEELKVGGVKGGLRSKPRFSFTEIKMLLEAVKRNRYIILKKFNQGVSAEAKKQTWAEITNQINGLGENHREVRQIMKKWADLKCDAKRRIVALRGPNGKNLRKKNLGPLEKMVLKILMMSPKGDGDSDVDLEEDHFSKLPSKGPPANPSVYSYLGMTDDSLPLPESSFEISPLSSPEKDPGERHMDFDDDDDSMLSVYHSSLPPSVTALEPLPDDALMRLKPVYTYSRNNTQNHNHIQNHTSSRPPAGPSTSLDFPPVSDSDAALTSAPPLPSQSPTSSSVAASSLPASSSSASPTVKDSMLQPMPSSIPPPAGSSSSAPSSNSTQPDPSSFPHSRSSTLDPNLSDPLPAGMSSRRAHDQVSQLASQSLQQQRASRMLLTSVSQSLETLAQSVQLLVESQHEFVQESLMLQRETVDILKDFSNTALTMLRDKSSMGQMVTQQHPASRFNY